LLLWPPVTIPPSWIFIHGVRISPPPHPLYTEKHTAPAESGSASAPFEAMHARSDAAETPAKAQQHPQLPWSRMSLMSLAQWGQCEAESKTAGMSAVDVSFGLARRTDPLAMAVRSRSG
jgi:hypothetical protein